MNDDAELIACIQQGTELEARRAWGELYKGHGDHLAHYLASKGLVHEELKDIASTAWMKALESISRFEYRADVGFFPWLRQIADWVRLDHFRKRYLKDVPLGEEHEPVAPAEDDPERQAVSSITQDELREILRDAPEAYRTVIEGRYFCDMSLNDIRHIEGWSREQVDSNHHRAVKWLRKRLLDRSGDAARDDWLAET